MSLLCKTKKATTFGRNLQNAALKQMVSSQGVGSPSIDQIKRLRSEVLGGKIEEIQRHMAHLAAYLKVLKTNNPGNMNRCIKKHTRTYTYLLSSNSTYVPVNLLVHK